MLVLRSAPLHRNKTRRPRARDAASKGAGSPDRVDALVWGFTELFPSLTTKTGPVFTPGLVHAIADPVVGY